MKFINKIQGLRPVIRGILWVGCGLSVVIGIICLVYLFSAKTTLSGKQTIQSLGDAVVITFDESGIPHIKAKSSTDALFALGYLHASERSW